jgi:molybdopterin guanine dinucleotide-containing S/N-oxide reductase-like protein
MKEKKMEEEKEKRKEVHPVSRRSFLKGAGLVAGGAVAGAAAGAGVTYGLVSGPETAKEVETVKEVVKEVPVATEGMLPPAQEPEESFLGPYGTNVSDAAVIDTKNGKIVRMRPFHWDMSYTEEQVAPSLWEFTARGKTFKSSHKSYTGYLSLAYKKRIYSPGRILWPLKRVDWEPGGDPAKINPQNRGISKYKRISWDEAASIIASEIVRVQEKYGDFAVMFAETPAHRETKTLHWAGSIHGRMLGGGESGKARYTEQVRNADSWEGWYWGMKFLAGEGAVGMMAPAGMIWYDVAQNTDMLVIHGGDVLTTSQNSRARLSLFYRRDLGIKFVHIAPDINYTNAAFPDKWIPVLPNTDAALQMAIVYTWLKEGTWDKEYVDTHCVGMDKIEAYIMGTEDGVPKTPEWASSRCGVPEWTIKALARAWAKKKTSIGHNLGGSMIRGPYSHEPARWEGVLLGMQGVGRPGVHMFHGMGGNSPRSAASASVGSAMVPGRACRQCRNVRSKQFVPKTLVHHAILDHSADKPMSWYGHTANAELTPDLLTKFTYPIAAEEGGSDIHMFWNDKPCNIACWNGGFKLIEAYRSPQMECMVVQHQWFSNDCKFADIILPISTSAELNDIQAPSGDIPVINYMKAAIAHVGESKSDYEATVEVAKKLAAYGGKYADALTALTENRTEEEWLQYGYEGTAWSKKMSWDEFLKAPYALTQPAADWQNDKAGMIDFYNDPVENPRDTPSGKLEFWSQRLADTFPDDVERGPMPKWVVGGPNPNWSVGGEGWTHDERLESERAKTYPFLLMSNHPRWRVHVQCDDVPWLREIETCKVVGPDGYWYEPLWINPIDAEKLGIKHGDIVKMWNERGIELGGAYVTERIIPGAVYQDHGAREDWISTEPGNLINRGGTNNQISPEKGISKNCWGMATSGYLVNVAKLDPAEMEKWKMENPEAFERSAKRDMAYGETLMEWVVEGGA